MFQSFMAKPPTIDSPEFGMLEGQMPESLEILLLAVL
jgi:hypothetical protein